MRRKVILFDIDGTLVECQKGHTSLTDKTKKALRKLKEAGHYIFIATGRPYCYLLEELIDFEFDGYILDDGAYVLFNNKELAYHPFHINKLEPMLKQVKDKNMTYVAYTKKYAYVYNDDGTLVDYAHTFMINDKYVRKIQEPDEKKDEVLKIHVQTRNEKDYDHFMIIDNDYCYAEDKEHCLYEIYSRDYSKATALDEVLKEIDIKIEDTYFFGDGYNDIEMMDHVGYAIAMANAPKEVQEHADHVCKSVDQDGVADFIMNSNLLL